jgi:hypothetical protein
MTVFARARRGTAGSVGLVVAAVGVAAVVAGCGSSSGGTLSQGGGSTPPATTTTSRGAPGGGVGRMPTSPPPGQPVGKGKVIQVKGMLERGAEPSCVVLRTTRGAYDLMGPVAQRLRPDHEIVLLGRVVVGVASHCMDGTPFEVTAIATR